MVQPPRWQSNWSQYESAEPLPTDWDQRRLATARRAGGRCERRKRLANGTFRRCPNPGSECDHKVPRSRGGSSELENLEWLCKVDHSIKTQHESADARRAAAAKLKHPAQKHPGML